MSTEIVSTRLDVDTEALAALATLLSCDERERARRFAFAHLQRRFIAGRGLLRQLMGERLGRPGGTIEFTYGAHGKPHHRDLHFNVSHSGDAVVYAFSDDEVGVDMEAVDDDRNLDGIARRFFSTRENDTYNSLDGGDRLVGFFNCWTRKEAFIKAIGDGLSMPLDSFDVTLAPHDPAKLLRVGDRPGEECRWQLRGFSPAPGYIAAVVDRTR